MVGGCGYSLADEGVRSQELESSALLAPDFWILSLPEFPALS